MDARSPRFCLCLFALILASPISSFAVPTVSIDAQPTVMGVQDTISVAPGASFTVDITIEGIEASSPLNGFEFDLLFDPSVVTAVSVVNGGFLLAPAFVVQEEIGLVTVDFAEVTLGLGGAVGEGVLATVELVANGTGISALDLENVILAAPFGVPIAASIVDGSVRVQAAVIPEPASILTLAIGLVLVAPAARRSC